MDQDIYEKPYNHTKFSLISETNDNNFEIFMTEKIWKPIIAGHVFIIHGNHLYLQKLKELGFRDWVPNMSAREQLTQASFIGAIGGFRSLVASIYDLRAHEAFRDKDWGSVERFRKVTTSLQPVSYTHLTLPTKRIV